MTSTSLGGRPRFRARLSPAVKVSASVVGVLLLLGARTATSDPAPTDPAVNLVARDTGTATGPLINTHYGPVQVRVTVTGGSITDVQAVQLPSGGKNSQISGYAAPVLRREALASQGAGIDAVSGASYTSQGYSESLQGALDQISAGGSPAPAGHSAPSGSSA